MDGWIQLIAHEGPQSLLLAEDYVRVVLIVMVCCARVKKKRKEGIIGLPLSLSFSFLFTIVCVFYSLVVGADYSGGWWMVMIYRNCLTCTEQSGEI